MARKLIIGIFISIFAIFVMSHNVGAIQFTINLDDYSLSRNADRPAMQLFYNDDSTTCLNVAQCAPYYSTDFTRIKKIKTYASYSIKTGDIVVLRMFVAAQNPAQGTFTTGSPLMQLNYTTNVDNFVYLGSDVVDVSTDLNLLSQLGYGPNSNEYYTQLTTIYRDLKVYDYYFKSSQDLNIPIGFEVSNYNSNSANLYNYPSYSSPGAIYFKLLNLKVYSPAESKENKEVEEKTQSAVDESAQSGESSQGSVEGSTQNLMSAGASIISALSNAPATDCNINMSTSGSSSAFTGAIGSVNLCSGVPSGVLTMVQGIVALVFTPIVLYYTYSIITTIYKQFKEYNS